LKAGRISFVVASSVTQQEWIAKRMGSAYAVVARIAIARKKTMLLFMVPPLRICFL
jgi:hypothetical protein